MRELALESNLFRGELPGDVRGMRRLQSLWLHANHLRGLLPEQGLQGMSRVESARLQWNGFEGTLQPSRLNIAM
eukprot:3973144-Amphidinium_carterae.1